MLLREGEPRTQLEPEATKSSDEADEVALERRIRCRHCRESIARRDAGTTRHIFANPAGRVFEIVTVREARLEVWGTPTEEHTWFPGFAWRTGSCPGCGFHLGWIFDPVGEGVSFCGLITSEIHES